MSSPRVSVVVSSYERPDALGRLLAALARQTLAAEDFEVIVVDNGSGPRTAQTLAAAQGRGDLILRTLRHERSLGPAGGRNSGWRAGVAPLVAFTDDDCRPDPSWLAELLAAHAAHAAQAAHAAHHARRTHTARTTPAGAAAAPPLIVQGATLPDPDQLIDAPHRLFSRIVQVTAADGRYETCNILYPRVLLEALDGFDERFLPRGRAGRPVGEDTDLGWRARARGAGCVFAPGAVVLHDVDSLSPLDALTHGTRWGGAVHLFRVHPEAREILFRRYFWNVWHYMGLRALLALLGPAWLRRLLVSRYLGAMRRRAREVGVGSWAVPYLIACDATEAAALIRASIRERTCVL